MCKRNSPHRKVKKEEKRKRKRKKRRKKKKRKERNHYRICKGERKKQTALDV